MALKWASTTVLDGGLTAIKTGATRMLLISAYAANDSYATVVANALATVTMVNGDFTITGASGAARVLTVAGGKSATASASAPGTPDLHIAFTNAVDTVLWVTDETSNQAIVSGNTINFPSGITYTSNQPT